MDECLGASHEMTSTSTDAGDVRTGFTKGSIKKMQNQIKCFFLFLTVSLALNTRLFLTES